MNEESARSSVSFHANSKNILDYLNPVSTFLQFPIYDVLDAHYGRVNLSKIQISCFNWSEIRSQVS